MSSLVRKSYLFLAKAGGCAHWPRDLAVLRFQLAFLDPKGRSEATMLLDLVSI
jgi:hypothetical protein